MKYKKLRIVVGMIIIIGCFYAFISAFRIQTVTVQGATAQVFLDNHSFPSNLLFFPTERIRKELLDQYPQFQDIFLTKEYPSTLVIHIVPRIPIARLMTNSRSVALDSSGIVLGESDDATLPSLFLNPTEIHTGEKPSGVGIGTSLAFLSVIGQDHIESIIMEDAYTLKVKTSQMIILLDQNGDGSQSARTLQGLLSGFRIKGTQPKIVDLRFVKPVVTF